MTIENFLLNDLKPLNFESKLDEALILMEEYRFTHYPIINKDKMWAGNVSYEKLITEFNVTNHIAPDILEDFCVKEEEFFLSSVTIFGSFKTNLIPVIDLHQNYLGYIFLEDIMSELSKYPFFNNQSNWLSVQNTTAKFALSEVTKILESNNAKSFGIIMNGQNENTTSAHISLLAENTDSLIQTFERFGYTIKVFKIEGEYSNLMNDRYNNLLRYMDI